jgi:hypothetical protein
MALKRLRPRVVMAGLAVAGILAATAGTASASTATTTAPVRPASSTAKAAVPSDTVVFTPVGRAAPHTTFGCSVTAPEVTDTFSNGEFTWSAAVSCSITLEMQGTTVLYQWGSSSAYAFGSSYNDTSSYNTSSGSDYGIYNGTWGVNNNVLLFVPAGYTTTIGSGCYYATTTEIHCTVTTGPITAQ